MDSHFINATIYDQTTKKSRTLCISSICRLSELRQLIQKEWQIKDFRFINDGALCIRGTQKHIPVQMYLKAYKTLSIATQRQQPKKQSKMIQKQSKKQQVMIRHNMMTHAPEQVTQRAKIALEQPRLLTTQQTINQKHFRWSKQNIEYCKFKYNIQLCQDGYGLDHDYTAVDMQEFTKYDWGNIQWLGLYGCGIDDNGWRLFVDKAQLFSKLKILGIKDNLITTVKQGDLEKFTSLRIVQFGTLSGPNPLSKQTKQYLSKFKKQNRHIKVKFRN